MVLVAPVMTAFIVEEFWNIEIDYWEKLEKEMLMNCEFKLDCLAEKWFGQELNPLEALRPSSTGLLDIMLALCTLSRFRVLSTNRSHMLTG